MFFFQAFHQVVVHHRGCVPAVLQGSPAPSSNGIKWPKRFRPWQYIDKWHCHFMTPIPIVQDSKPQACSLRRCIGLTTGMTQPHSWGMLGYDPLSSDTYVPIYIKSGMICKIRQPFSYTQTVSCMHHLVIPSSCTPHPSLLRFLLAIFCAHSFNLRLPEGNVVSR